MIGEEKSARERAEELAIKIYKLRNVEDFQEFRKRPVTRRTLTMAPRASDHVLLLASDVGNDRVTGQQQDCNETCKSSRVFHDWPPKQIDMVDAMNGANTIEHGALI